VTLRAQSDHVLPSRTLKPVDPALAAVEAQLAMGGDVDGDEGEEGEDDGDDKAATTMGLYEKYLQR
jgi:hypothetical protein